MAKPERHAAKETESRTIAVEADGMIEVPPGKVKAEPHDPYEMGLCRDVAR